MTFSFTISGNVKLPRQALVRFDGHLIGHIDEARTLGGKTKFTGIVWEHKDKAREFAQSARNGFPFSAHPTIRGSRLAAVVIDDYGGEPIRSF